MDRIHGTAKGSGPATSTPPTDHVPGGKTGQHGQVELLPDPLLEPANSLSCLPGCSDRTPSFREMASAAEVYPPDQQAPGHDIRENARFRARSPRSPVETGDKLRPGRSSGIPSRRFAPARFTISIAASPPPAWPSGCSGPPLRSPSPCRTRPHRPGMVVHDHRRASADASSWRRWSGVHVVDVQGERSGASVRIPEKSRSSAPDPAGGTPGPRDP